MIWYVKIFNSHQITFYIIKELIKNYQINIIMQHIPIKTSSNNNTQNSDKISEPLRIIDK